MTALTESQIDEVLARYDPPRRLRTLKRFLKKKRNAQERTLRSHFVDPIVDEDEIKVRYNLDEFLDMASAIEIITLATGALPELERTFAEDLSNILRNKAVQRYYTVHYPLPLPILLREQLCNPDASHESWRAVQRASAKNKDRSVGYLLSFFELEARRRRNHDLELFLDLLDGYHMDGFGMADLLKLISDRKKLEKAMSVEPKRAGMNSRALNGLNQFMAFCADLDYLCNRCSRRPIIRAAIWLHFCYWFRERSHHLRATSQKLGERLKDLIVGGDSLRHLQAFIDSAAGPRISIHAAFDRPYLTWAAKPLAMAENRGVKVALICRAPDSKTALATGLSRGSLAILNRETPVDMDFAIICRNGKPTRVWTAFGRAQSGAVIADQQFTAQFYDYWNYLATAPSTRSDQMVDHEHVVSQLRLNASPFDEEVDAFVKLVAKLTNWQPYAQPLVDATAPLLDAWSARAFRR